MANERPLHVAVGVIEDSGRVLIAQRPRHLHQGGLWEFPGGKVNQDEDVVLALGRELYEELDIVVRATRPLITIEHDYGDKQVFLDVHRVMSFDGTAYGKEGQEVRWVNTDELGEFEFPAANRGILNAIRLPDRYLITGDFASILEFEQNIESAIDKGIHLIQIRAKHLSSKDYVSLVERIKILESTQVKFILNTSLDIFLQVDTAGLHLTSQRLMQYRQRPIPNDKLLSVSVHDQTEIRHANSIGADMLLLSPVLATLSHPDSNMLGWERLQALISSANCPVYALGGMQQGDITQAQTRGAQGIAGISAWWPRH